MLGIFRNKDREIREWLDAGAMIVDVRTEAEFVNGHAGGSVNIPLDALDHHVTDLKREGKPVVLCCETGFRSGIATKTLHNAGLQAINAGSWKKVRAITQQSSRH